MTLIQAEDRASASQQAANRIATALARDLATKPLASFIASGGTTPIECYRALAKAELDWSRVHVIPSDEREVPLDDDQRNSKMLRQSLRQCYAGSCVIHEIEDFNALPKPAAITLLGMGEDGHFASIFPDISELNRAVDLSTTDSLLAVQTTASALRRTTLTLSALCNSQQVLILAYGEKKLGLLTQPDDLPIQHVLAQTKTPVEIIWSP